MSLRRCSGAPGRRAAFRGALAAACGVALCLVSPARADDRDTVLRAFAGRGLLLPFERAGLTLQEPPPPPQQPPPELPDLSKLSLEELLGLEITPINVLGSHTHLEDQWMIGYRFMFMSMKGNRDGTHPIGDFELIQRFPTIHTEMEMEMHMLELMYAPTDRHTFMVMVPWKTMRMDHLSRTGHRFTQISAGIGDIVAMGMYTFHGDPRRGGLRAIANLGVSFPTGSIRKRDATPTNPRARLEYGMQTGAGTYGLLPGITLLGESRNWAWGTQAISTLWLGRNDIGWRFGNEYRLNAWVTYRVTDWFGPSLRLDGRSWGNVKGRDPELNPLANPAADPRRQGGRRVDLLLGLNFYAPRGKLKGNRLTIEGGLPIYQWLDGPQIENDWQITAGWSYTYR